jgi:hypothetical protein
MPFHPAIDKALAWAQFAYLSDASRWLPDYKLRHEALRRLFKQYVAPGEFHTILAGAYAVCGWMRRPLCGLDRARFERAKRWLALLAACEDSATARNALEGQTEAVRHAALTFVGDSAVMTSKFLHFLNPACAPMWDASAAACLDLRACPNQTPEEQAALYCRYWDELLAAASAGASPPPRLQNILKAPLDARLDHDRLRASLTCALEFLLFVYGRSASIAPSPAPPRPQFPLESR